MILVGRNNVKNPLKTLAIASLFLSVTASANKSAEVKLFDDLKKVNIKCYVQVAGGGSSVIKYYDLPVKYRSDFEKDLLRKGFKRGKKTFSIQKIMQCVETHKKFTDYKANDIEDKINEMS